MIEITSLYKVLQGLLEDAMKHNGKWMRTGSITMNAEGGRMEF